MMQSGNIFISGYWPRESNQGFRDNCGTNTSYATEAVSRLDTMVLGGSMKTLKLFGIQSCQMFNWLKRCASKNEVLRCNTKTDKFESVSQKRKMAENFH